jgi:hypothetical protein
MNEKQKIVTFILALMCNFTFLATAQEAGSAKKLANHYTENEIPKCDPNKPMGTDSLETIRNMAAFKDDYTLKNYDLAYSWWHYVFTNAPCSYKQLYIFGPAVIQRIIDKPKYAKRKEHLIDTLLMCYRAKFEYFPGEVGGNYPSKATYALALNKYRPDTQEVAMKYYNEYFNEVKDSVYDPNALTYCMKTALELYNKKRYSVEGLFELYDQMSTYALISIDRNQDPKDSTNKKYFESSSYYLDKMMTSLLKCDRIDDIYQPKLQADSNNIALIKKVLQLYARANCTESPNFMPLVEKSYKLEPNADAAAVIGANFEKQDNMSKALYYYEQAAELYENKKKKEDMYIKLANAYLNTNLSTAKSYAQKALALNPNNGLAIIVQGLAIYKAKCGDAFDQAMAACVAVDYFIKAKTVDPSCADKANTYINNYSKSYPLKEDVFFRNLSAGASYTISCSGYTTTIRIR